MTAQQAVGLQMRRYRKCILCVKRGSPYARPGTVTGFYGQGELARKLRYVAPASRREWTEHIRYLIAHGLPRQRGVLRPSESKWQFWEMEYADDKLRKRRD